MSRLFALRCAQYAQDCVVRRVKLFPVEKRSNVSYQAQTSGLVVSTPHQERESSWCNGLSRVEAEWDGCGDWLSQRE